MPDGSNLTVAGHTLVKVGWPHDEDGHALDQCGGPGRARCSCGELSPILDSDSQRRRWHRTHKQDVIEVLGDAVYVCSVDTCTGDVKARGLCTLHLHRLHRHGDPLGGRTPDGALLAFIEAAIDGTAPVEPNGCILWPYGTSSGYPYISTVELGSTRVGTIILERTVGPKPSDRHTVGHAPREICGNTLCIAPAHLAWQTWDEQAVHRRLDGTDPRADVSDEAVADAVKRVRSGEPVSQVASDVGVSTTTIYRWRDGRSRPLVTRRGVA